MLKSLRYDNSLKLIASFFNKSRVDKTWKLKAFLPTNTDKTMKIILLSSSELEKAKAK